MASDKDLMCLLESWTSWILKYYTSRDIDKSGGCRGGSGDSHELDLPKVTANCMAAPFTHNIKKRHRLSYKKSYEK